MREPSLGLCRKELNLWHARNMRKGHSRRHINADMPADGLTKALGRQKFEHFRALLNLQDASHIIMGEHTTGKTAHSENL
jgi:hypothetical protein